MKNWIQNNFWSFFYGIFAFVATLLGVIGFLNWNSSQKLMREGVYTEGIVTNMRYNNSGSASPTIEFDTEKFGHQVYYSSMYSSPPAYAVGERVKLWYDPEHPQKVVMSGLDLWLLPAIFGGFFLVFGSIGYIGLAKQWRNSRRQDWLQRYGKTIEATFTEVRINHSVRINTRSPYYIVCQWFDPYSNKIYNFESESIWFNPEGFVPKTIKVRVNPKDFREYKVDLSFLPELGN